MRPIAFKTCSIALATLFAIAATGCGARAHETIDSGKACESCHSEKQTYDVSEPKDAITCGNTITVETDAESVAVCAPIFTSEDGSAYVPELRSQAKVENGTASIELDEGTYAICLINGSKVEKSQIVTVKEGASEATINL